MFFCLFEAGAETRFELPSRQSDVHFGFIPGVRVGQRYGLRAEGPYDATNLFDASKLLIDPYATAIDRSFTWHGIWPSRALNRIYSQMHRSAAAAGAAFALRKPRFIYEVAVKASPVIRGFRKTSAAPCGTGAPRLH